MLVYHATRRTSLPDILVEGLIGGSNDMWGVKRGELSGDPVHLSDTDTREFISELFEEPLGEIALLLVDVSGLELLPGWDGDGSYTYPGTIEPARLRLMIGV